MILTAPLADSGFRRIIVTVDASQDAELTETPSISQATADVFNNTTYEETIAGAVDAADGYVIACDTTLTVKYLLGAVEIPGSRISQAASGSDDVTITMDNEGTQQFAMLSQELSTKVMPENQVAFTIAGEVVAAPAISSTITDGVVTITSSTTAEAGLLADYLALIVEQAQFRLG